MQSLHKLKGCSTTKTYSTKGAQRHDIMSWESKKSGRCNHRRIIKSGSICMVSSKITCPQSGREDVGSICPANNYDPKIESETLMT